MNKNEPHIYVACLASYNCGILYGCWINALQDPDKILHDIRKMLAHSPLLCGDEWAIHDYENFHSFKLDEFEDIESICQKAKFVAEHGELGTKIMSYLRCDIEDAARFLDDNYYGAFESETAFAEHYFDEFYRHETPEFIQWFIDMDSFRIWLLDNDYFAIESNMQTHVFYNQ